MEISLFVVLAVSLMFSGVYGQGYSYSSSCSMVNGRQICEENKGQGNSASSSSRSYSGPDGTFQNVNSNAGGQESRQEYQTGGGVNNAPGFPTPGFPIPGFPIPGFPIPGFPGTGAFAFAGRR